MKSGKLRALMMALIMVLTLIPNSLQVRAETFVDGEHKYGYRELHSNIYIDSYEGPGGEINIPAEINGISRIYINEGAFGEKELTNVTLPAGTKFIGENAFYRNQIKNIKIPEGVIYIEKRAFHLNQIERIEIPEGVQVIGKSAFFENPIKSIVIPNSVTTIGEQYFGWNTGTYSKDIIIYGQLDSRAQSYANDYNHTFIGLTSAETASINKTAIELIANEETETLIAILPRDAINQTITWSSTNESVARVDKYGLVSPISEGECTITIDVGGYSASCQVSVSERRAVEGISLDANELTITEGKEQRLTATITPENATDQNITWSSSNESIARVDQSGLIKALSQGRTDIKVTTADGGYEAICELTVNKLIVYDLIVENGTDETGAGPYEAGTEVSIKANSPEDGFQFKEWTSNNGLSFNDKHNVETIFTMPEGDTIVSASFRKDESKWHSVTFESGVNGVIEGTVNYEDVLTGSKLSQVLTVPQIIPDAGYKFSLWTPNLPEKVTQTGTYTANFIKDEAQWHTVRFEAGANGLIEGKASFTDILVGRDWSEVINEMPTPKANSGYKFAGWRPSLPEKITEDATYTAVFIEDKEHIYTIELASIVISKGTEDDTIKISHSGGEEDNIPKDTVLAITGQSTKHDIEIKDGVTANITFDNLSITGEKTANITGNSNVNLTLKGENKLENKLKGGGVAAGLAVSPGNSLTVTEMSTGSLIATGGVNGAGIGGSTGYSAGTITIQGGEVTATGGSGGTVTSSDKRGGAGIGGGIYGSGGNISITGGRVIAQGQDGGAGIGGGGDGGSGGKVRITGGIVIANGLTGAAGIGGGIYGSGGEVIVDGGQVTATSTGGGAAGIGGGNLSPGGIVTINGGIVNAKGFGRAAGIGGGGIGSGPSVTVTGGYVNAIGGLMEDYQGTLSYVNGIGGGDQSNDTGSFTAKKDAFVVATGIGDPSYKNNSDTQGIIFADNQGVIYGSPSISGDATIPEGKTFAIESGKIITVDSGVTLTNNGTLIIDGGKLQGQGTLSGLGKFISLDGIKVTLASDKYTGLAIEPNIIIPEPAILTKEFNSDISRSFRKKNEEDNWNEVLEIKDVGQYRIMLDSIVLNEFTIGIGNGKGSVTMEGWTYNTGGFSKNPLPVSVTNGTDNVNYEYKIKGKVDTSYSSTKPSNAGEYTVKAIFAKTPNSTQAVATADFTIAKAIAQINPPIAGEITYGDKLFQSILSGQEELGSFIWANSNIIPIVGNQGYDAIFKANANTLQNYKSVTDIIKRSVVTVNKANPVVDIRAKVSGEKGSRQVELTASLSKVGSGETPRGTFKFVNSTEESDEDIEGAETVVVKNGGATFIWRELKDQDYKVKVVYSGDANYISNTSNELSFNTSKKDQENFKIDDIGSKNYGDDSFNISTTGGSGNGVVKFESSDASILSIIDNRATIHKAGNVNITAIKSGDDEYNEAISSLSLNIGNIVYKVSVINGTGSGSYSKNQTVTISANNRSGYTFTEWSSNHGDIFNDKSARSTVFQMLDEPVTITANYSKNSSGDNTGGGSSDSGGSSGGSSSSGESGDDNPKDEDTTKYKDTTKVETTKEPDGPTKVIASTSSTVTKDTVNVQVSKNTVKDAIKEAQAAAKKNNTEEDGISVEIKVDTKNIKASNLSANIGKSTLEDLTKTGVKDLRINSDVALISLDLETLKTIQSEIGGDVNISAKKVEKTTLSAQVQEMVGDRPVFDFSITGSNGEQVRDFGKGKIAISIPYTLNQGEKGENLVVYYINEEGQVEEIRKSLYDEKSGIIAFETDHFSKFAVGYKEDQVAIAFTDIENHWAKDNIKFVTERGLFTGTGQNKFSPDMSMTRGMFVTVLGRLANADVSSYKASSFTDVKTNAYYMPYTEWANQMGIVEGIGENKFAPETPISREQMAVIMANYACSIDLKLAKTHEEKAFEDSAEISNYGKAAVKEMQISGIISGKDKNKFDPKGRATRAEVSAVLKRFIDILEKK